MFRWIAVASICLVEAQLVLAGPVRRLSVAAVGTPGAVRLNVSWLPPASGIRPTFYSVAITSERPRRPSCSEGSIYHFGPETRVLLPQNRFPGDEAARAHELEVEPGCAYRVQVFAQGRNNLGDAGAPAASTVFEVPRCVGGRCSCEEPAREALPPEVSARTLEDARVLVSWRDESPGRRPKVDAYKISVGTPHLTSSSGQVVYNRTEIFAGPVKDNSFVWSSGKLTKGLKIFVAAQDEYGCPGKEGSFTAKEPLPSPFYRKNAVIIAFAGVVALFFTLAGVISFIRYFARNHNYKHISLGPKSSRSLARVSQSPKTDALLKQRNVLYVEQAGQEAGCAGDEGETGFGRLRLARQLGRGQFGVVYLADLRGPAAGQRRPVAVKMSLASGQSESRKQLLEEIAMTKMAGSHPNLVGLLGYCTRPEQPVCLILEYMEGGDLLSYLHRLRDARAAESRPPDSPGVPSIAETERTSLESPGDRGFFPGDIAPEERGAARARFAREIAEGMGHLEARGILHRDLAARNVLMDERLTLKISDFGLSRRGVYTLGGFGTRRLPIRWMSPEAVSLCAVTSKSDIWSYGVVLWEIASLGGFPYARLSDDEVLHHLLEEDGRPEVLQDAPEILTRIMNACWASKPDRRPDFRQIILWLNDPNVTSAAQLADG